MTTLPDARTWIRDNGHAMPLDMNRRTEDDRPSLGSRITGHLFWMEQDNIGDMRQCTCCERQRYGHHDMHAPFYELQRYAKRLEKRLNGDLSYATMKGSTL